MANLFLCYPKCSTCKKAAFWLSENNIANNMRDIVVENPTAEELTQWVAQSGLPVSRFFNTSGLRYRALNIKDKVRVLPNDELIEILATDGMLVKRPLLITEKTVLVGFRQAEWEAALLGK